MTEAEIPDYNIFMMCTELNEQACTELSADYYFRNCRPDELELWKAFLFATNSTSQLQLALLGRLMAKLTPSIG